MSQNRCLRLVPSGGIVRRPSRGAVINSSRAAALLGAIMSACARICPDAVDVRGLEHVVRALDIVAPEACRRPKRQPLKCVYPQRFTVNRIFVSAAAGDHDINAAIVAAFAGKERSRPK